MFETEEVTLYPKAEPNDKIALIDADTIAYGACCVCEYQYYDIEANEDKYAINLNDAVDHAIGRIQQILDQTGCKTCELYFTSGYNFRYDVAPNYKANRVGIRRPEGLYEIKVELLKHYSGMICTGWEADDHVAYLKLNTPEQYILCAVDKDVLKSIPGKHFNYYSSDQHNIQPTFVEVDNKDAIMFNYLQAIMGDSSDGIKGVPGIGPKKAEKFLNREMSELEMWEAVVKAFESKDLDFIDALTTMRLVSIRQLKRQEDDGLAIELFDPFKELGYGN